MMKVVEWIAQSYARQECEALLGRMQGQCVWRSQRWKEKFESNVYPDQCFFETRKYFSLSDDYSKYVSLRQRYPKFFSRIILSQCFTFIKLCVLCYDTRRNAFHWKLRHEPSGNCLRQHSPSFLASDTPFQPMSRTYQTCKHNSPFQEVKVSPTFPRMLRSSFSLHHILLESFDFSDTTLLSSKVSHFIQSFAKLTLVVYLTAL